VRTNGYIVGISIYLQADRPYYLPIRHFGGDNMPISGVLHYLKSQAKEYTGTIVGANFQYDLDYLAEEGIVFPNVRHIRDVQIAEPLLYELHDSYSLDAIAKRWGYEGKSETLLHRAAKDFNLYKNPRKKKKTDDDLDHKGSMWKLPARFVGPYAEDDARLVVEIIVKQEEQLQREKLMGIYDLESRLQPVLLKMRRHGVRVDQDKLTEIEAWTMTQERLACAEIERRTGIKVGLGDVNKKPKMSAVLHEIGVRWRQTPTGLPKIDNELLTQTGHPVTDLILQGRKMNKLRTTFVKSVRNHMVGGRLHCTFNQLRNTGKYADKESGAKYGRMSCSHPNLQQQPSRDDFAPMWRSIYLPDEGVPLWMSADYSQQEPRMLVHFAELLGLDGAKAAADRYRNDPNADNHQMMADMASIARKQAKAIFLGLCYGMGSGKLASDLGLHTQIRKRPDGSVYLIAGAEGQALFDKFDRAVPFVKKLARRCELRAKNRGYIKTLLGRRCRFPVTATGQYDWTFKSLNRLIQGSSADQMKMAMVEIDRANENVQLQVHDEVCGGVESPKVAGRISEIMLDCVQLQVPSKVDIELGPSWGEAK
jgi:DNA polymerase I-like protein with 3'-5' exonuclease and polymerase domains